MSLYELMKTIHVLAASAWVGGAVISHVQGALVAKSKDQQRVLNFTKEQNWLGNRYFAPLSIVVILGGIVMVLDSGIEFEDTWIVIGIALWAATVFVGAALIGPTGKKLEASVEARGLEDAESQKLWGSLKRLSTIDVTLLVLIVIDMVVKPGA